MNKPPGRAYLGVGSNIDPDKNVMRALEALSATAGIKLSAISTFFRTAALSDPSRTTSVPGQAPRDPDPDFLNGVLEIRTVLTPTELLAVLGRIETNLGRERGENRFAPRTIDLDLLLYGRSLYHERDLDWEEVGPGGLMVHADIERRAFVALPLFELAPDLILPPHRTPLQALAASFDSPGGRAEHLFTEDMRRQFLSP